MKFLTLALLPLLMACSSAQATPTITLNTNNTLILDSPVDSQSTSVVMAEAMRLDRIPTKEPIYLVLNTPGGSIGDGILLYNFLQGMHRPVHTITIFAASMGFQIVQNLGTRHITQYGTLMAHKARGSFSGEFPGQLNNRLSYYMARLDEMDAATVARTKGKFTKQAFQAAYENEYWVDGFDAVKNGLADSVVSVKCGNTLAGTHNTMVPFMGFSVKVTLSDCPMIVGPLAVEGLVHTKQGLISVDVLNKKNALSPMDVATINKEIESIRKNYSTRAKVIYTTLPFEATQ
jgi:ATP-dependent Clp protease protease subunit